MSSEAVLKAAKVLGPKNVAVSTMSRADRRISVQAITTATQVLDIIGAAGGGGATEQLPEAQRNFVKMNAEADCYYYWSDNAAATLDETKTGDTNPEQQCDRLWSGQPTHEYAQGRYLVIKGVAACKLRMSISSEL